MMQSVFYRTAKIGIRLIGGAVVRRIYRMQAVHPDRVPATGGVLLLPNHVTFADGFFIAAVSRRPVRFVMDEAFMASRAVRMFTRIFQTVTIRRDQPREAIKITIDALKNGDVVCLFPEGQLTRTGTLGELRRGFELIARKAGHPLIPMWCDGSWGSIFSFEGNRFFHKRPRRPSAGMLVVFGDEIRPEDADSQTVRQGMLEAGAVALIKRFDSPAWSSRLAQGGGGAVRSFRSRDESTRRRMWANGYQLGQINALQRGHPFFILRNDPVPPGLMGLMVTFPELFGATIKVRDSVDGLDSASWVGGGQLREVLGRTQLCREIVFYDFGHRALEPVYRAGLRHCPCLAVDGKVIAMSMPDPPVPTATGEHQPGHKPGTWGKLLPGWVLLTSENGDVRAHGAAARDEGIQLPAGCFLDAEGFLTPKPAERRGG